MTTMSEPGSTPGNLDSSQPLAHMVPLQIATEVVSMVTEGTTRLHGCPILSNVYSSSQGGVPTHGNTYTSYTHLGQQLGH